MMPPDHGSIKNAIERRNEMLKKIRAALNGPTFLAAILPGAIAWVVTAASIATYAA
jgi:hypothetical protein